MKERLSDSELKDIYTLDEVHKWMEIKEGDVENVYYKRYIRQKKRLDNLLKYLKFNHESGVVEFGCGNGIFGELIHQKVKSYIGVDFSKDFIGIAKKRHKALKISNSRFVCADIVKFSADYHNKFDMAFSIDFSEHIYDDAFVSIFTAIRITLRGGGELYIHTPNADYFLEWLKEHGFLMQVTGHIGIRNAREYASLLKKAGFTNIVVNYLPHYIKLLSFFNFMGQIPFLGKYFKARLLIKCVK